jgi:hypothetical protein
MPKPMKPTAKMSARKPNTTRTMFLRPGLERSKSIGGGEPRELR